MVEQPAAVLPAAAKSDRGDDESSSSSSSYSENGEENEEDEEGEEEEKEEDEEVEEEEEEEITKDEPLESKRKASTPAAAPKAKKPKVDKSCLLYTSPSPRD